VAVAIPEPVGKATLLPTSKGDILVIGETRENFTILKEILSFIECAQFTRKQEK
jgi:hypothetical protein